MMKLYKLTDGDGQTHNGTQWGPGVSHSGTGKGELCGEGWIHAYENPLVAALLNPIHANVQNPRMWEAEGEIAIRDGQLKCGCKTLTTVREIQVPAITTEMRVRFGILSAKEVCACLSWNSWADKWLSGEDRTQAEAERARARAAQVRSADMVEAAESAAEGARAWARAWARSDAWAARSAAWSAAWAAVRAAYAARDAGAGIDIFAIAECSVLRNKAGISKTVGSMMKRSRT